MQTNKISELEKRLKEISLVLQQKDLLAKELVHYRTKESLLQEEYKGITGAYYNPRSK